MTLSDVFPTSSHAVKQKTSCILINEVHLLISLQLSFIVCFQITTTTLPLENNSESTRATTNTNVRSREQTKIKETI